MMNGSQLTRWITAWSDQYGTEHDDQLHHVMGRTGLDREAFKTVIDWKFHRVANRRARAHDSIAGETDAVLSGLSTAACGSPDDDVAMRIITRVVGVGPALGSALLMVMDSTRWTVLDVRALKTIRAIGYSDVPAKPHGRATWLPYLQACRDVAARTELPLRTVDRALFAAKGATDLPQTAS